MSDNFVETISRCFKLKDKLPSEILSAGANLFLALHCLLVEVVRSFNSDASPPLKKKVKFSLDHLLPLSYNEAGSSLPLDKEK